MIRNQIEYKSAIARITEHHLQLVDRREQLQASGLSDDQIEQRLGNLHSSFRRLEDEIATYEGEPPELGPQPFE